MDTLSAALRLAVLGLTTTFAALFILRLIIGMLARLSVRQVLQNKEPEALPNALSDHDPQESTADEDIAAIIAVLHTMGVTPKTGGRIHIEEVRG